MNVQKTVQISQDEHIGFLSMQNQLNELISLNSIQQARIEQLLKLIYGTKSERHLCQTDLNQLMLDFGLPAMGMPVQVKEVAAHSRSASGKDAKPVRTALPAHLKRVTIVIEPETDITDLVKIGEEVTEILELKVPEIFVLRTVRPKYATKEGGVVIAALPPRVIERGNAGPGLIAHLLVGKYVDHLPIQRQVKQIKRWGHELAESTVYEWTAAGAQIITPIYEGMVKKTLSGSYLQVDESPMKVLQGSEAKKGAHRGYMWVYHSPPDNVLFFDYRKGRDQSGPRELLQNFNGIIQTDGYQVYDAIAPHLNITLSGCMAHARRKFDEALTNDKLRADVMLDMIQTLYAIEKELKAKDAGIVYAERQRLSVPILEKMHNWMKAQAAHITPQSLIGKAIRYSMERWGKLTLYTQHGHLHIDNNAIENSIRPLALGRKNFMFAGSHESAQRIAMMYSIAGTCKKLGIDPQQYIEYLLTELPKRKVNDIDDLLPWNYAEKIKSIQVEISI